MIGGGRVTLRHYAVFVAVCDRMNMTAAAEKLFMSQSAVSQAVAELEAHYGVKLFERLSRKLYLTQPGEKLLGYARHIIRMNAEAEAEMRTLKRTGVIRVGASVTIGACLLPGLVAVFREKNPGTTIEVTENNTEAIQQMIMDDRLDLGLVEGDVTLHDIVTRELAEDELVLICAGSHPFAGRKDVSPGELAHESFILREVGSGTRRTFERAMAAAGAPWRASWTCNNADAIKAAVAAGLGVSVISRRAVARELEEGVLKAVPVSGLRFLRAFKLAYHKNKYFTQAMRAFVDFAFADEQK